jgi:hypothetical protein
MTERDGCRHPVFGRRLEESDDGIELDEILGLDEDIDSEVVAPGIPVGKE